MRIAVLDGAGARGSHERNGIPAASSSPPSRRRTDRPSAPVRSPLCARRRGTSGRDLVTQALWLLQAHGLVLVAAGSTRAWKVTAAGRLMLAARRGPAPTAGRHRPRTPPPVAQLQASSALGHSDSRMSISRSTNSHSRVLRRRATSFSNAAALRCGYSNQVRKSKGSPRSRL
jgi:hypothetical protein